MKLIKKRGSRYASLMQFYLGFLSRGLNAERLFSAKPFYEVVRRSALKALLILKLAANYYFSLHLNLNYDL